MSSVVDLPSLVFPIPAAGPTTSAGSVCAGGINPGSLCDPANPPPDTCMGGGTCTIFGGEVDGQNVTLDETLNSRIGNPASQGSTVDGFFLHSGNDLIVFMIDGTASLDSKQPSRGST